MSAGRIFDYDRYGRVIRFPPDHPYVKNFSMEELEALFPASRIEITDTPYIPAAPKPGKPLPKGAEGLEDLLA